MEDLELSEGTISLEEGCLEIDIDNSYPTYFDGSNDRSLILSEAETKALYLRLKGVFE